MATRYFFDIWNGDDLCADEEGMEFPNQKAAEIEAARSLADMAREMAPADDLNYFGACKPGELAHSSMWMAVSASRALSNI